MGKHEERDVDRLMSILDHCDRIESTYERIDKSYEIFSKDADFRDAILMNIVQIGEIAARLSDECRDRLSELPWFNIIGTRNIIVHGYIKVDDEIVWNIIENDIPALKTRIEQDIMSCE